MSRLAGMGQIFFSPTSLLEIRPSPFLESQNQTFAISLPYECEMERRLGGICAYISRYSISQTSLCFLHKLNYVCHYGISQTVLLFILKYMHTISSVALPNTMYGSQINIKWPTCQNDIFSTKKAWIPKRFHRPVSELPLSLLIQQWVKQAADEERSAKTPCPTLSKAGCMESVCKVLSIRYNSKMASHLLYKCQRAPWHLSGEGKKPQIQKSKSLPQI